MWYGLEMCNHPNYENFLMSCEGDEVEEKEICLYCSNEIEHEVTTLEGTYLVCSQCLADIEEANDEEIVAIQNI